MSTLGKVFLVGAGPGDPDLITARGIALLKKADVVLYDFLVHPNLLLHCKPDAIRVCVGKRKGFHQATQAEIHDLLARYSRDFTRIVRLKGGDPLLFGRGGEEMAFLHDAGIDYEVVPGVSSAFAVPAYAGIPLTDRDRSRSVAFVTGSPKAGDSLATLPMPKADTLVYLMGVSHLEAHCTRLQDEGWPDTTPAVLISKGTWAAQQTVVGTLKTLVSEYQKNPIPTPVLMVVGRVTERQADLAWRHTLPLSGQRVILTRALDQVQPWYEAFRDLGAEVVLMPTIAIRPVDFSIPDTPPDWLVFTSANGVRCFVQGLLSQGRDLRVFGTCRIASVGPQTTAALAAFGLKADIDSAGGDSAALASALPPSLSNSTVLLPGAVHRNLELVSALQARGATVTLLAVYETQAIAPPSIDLVASDIVVFSSGSTVHSFYRHPRPALRTLCLGKTAVDALAQQGLLPWRVASAPTLETLISDLLKDLS
ncbi:MAG: uroporphyrinogen-III C-methyltransferase [Candidatus Margulisiibacteriota bacterium]